jgi:phosphoribosylformylglycinamidine cyclo-ligase
MKYRESGVDIEAGTEAVRRIRQMARGTFTTHVLSDIGSFGGLFQLDTSRLSQPVLVASADGVGTKLKVAFMAGRHDTVGADLVNHCVNDILVQGAEPLFFLDYLATGVLVPEVAEQIVSGVARGCRENGCALLGGETAEMPGFYAAGEYDIAGFIVGVVDRERLIDGRQVTSADVLIGLPSAGLHTNGYSLARKIAFERLGLGIGAHVPELGASIGEVLLAPHRTYLPVVKPLLASGAIRAMAHITGGGITDNLPRVLPDNLDARIETSSWQVPAVFRWLQAQGGVPDADMRRTFNLGVGLIVEVSPADADRVMSALHAAGEAAWVIGDLLPGQKQVRYA